MEEKKKTTGLKICVVILCIIIILLLSAGAAIFYFTYYEPRKDEANKIQPTKEPLIRVSQTQSGLTDGYGIIGEAKILGEQIDAVLEGYTKDKDYSTGTHDKYDVYTFENVEYGIGTHSSLLLFADQKSDTISLIEYDFLVSDGGALAQIYALSKLEENITNTYNTDAYYMYKNGTNGYFKSGGYSELEYIMWTTDSIRATLMFLDYEPETNPLCHLFFDTVD